VVVELGSYLILESLIY